MTNSTEYPPMLSVERNPLGLSSEAYSVMLGMVDHCLNIRACMGMDEGFKDFDTEEEHDFVKELRALLDKPDAQHQGEPVAVVMPERRPFPCSTRDFGFNEAIDLVARLNEVKP